MAFQVECDDDGPCIDRGTVVWARGLKHKGKATGGTRQCQLEGCGSIRVGVRWPDGKLTWPCFRGMDINDKGELVIQ
jgi:hypothetical protein